MKILLLVVCLLIIVSKNDSSKSDKRRGFTKSIRTKATIGEVWPKPQSMSSTREEYLINRHSFHFTINETSQTCDLLTNAFNRYYSIIFDTSNYIYSFIQSNHFHFHHRNEIKELNVSDIPLLKELFVYVRDECEQWPSIQSNESYQLTIENGFAYLNSESIWGALRGLETFSQLIKTNDNLIYLINVTRINDYPRFQHRGLLLDTSRHYLSVNTIKMNLESMSMSKMNVFHFHIVDDQSYPYQSRLYPQLSDQGSYNTKDIYSQSDINDIILFARERGIRVIVEFDSPGHSLSWGKSIDILTHCYSEGKPNGELGPIDPTQNSTFIFLKNFFSEISDVFPDHYIHLGGDEVDFKCWRSNPSIEQFMKEMGFGIDYSLLEQYYMQRLVDIVNETGKGYIVWQEIIDHHVRVNSDTVVEVWKEPYEIELAKVTLLGYKAILSACWYLNLISYGQDWFKYYRCDPHDFIGTEKQKELVVGGEASMWGEYVDGTNVVSTTWPRASVVGERLWSSANVKDHEEATGRLEEQRCRYLKRGIPAAPINGPSFCDSDFDF